VSRPILEALEDRLLLASDMTQLAKSLGVHSSGPTHLYLNFDGLFLPTILPARGTNVQPYQDVQGGVDQTDQDIQEILFKTSEIYSPFDVEVSRLYGKTNADGSGDGGTTVFVGEDPTNVINGSKQTYSFTPANSMDDALEQNEDHVPHSNPNNVAFVDPITNAAAPWTVQLTPGTSATTGISRSIAHESGHTFGLVHVLDSNHFDIMNYAFGTSSMPYFLDRALATTNLNNNGSSTGPSDDLQPEYGEQDITTQDSFSYLQTALGNRPSDGRSHIADITTVDPNYTLGGQHVPAAVDVGSFAPVDGNLYRLGDYDVFQVSSAQTKQVHVDLYPTGGNLNPILLEYDTSGKLLQYYTPSFNSSTNRQEIHTGLITFNKGNYFFVVGSHDANTTGTYHFQILGQPPFASPLQYSILPGQTLYEMSGNQTLASGVSDAENDQLTFIQQTQPANGRITVFDRIDGAFTYVPNAGFRGTDSFLYAAADRDGVSNAAQVSISVGQAPPQAFDHLYDVNGKTGFLSVTAGQGLVNNATDAENDAITAMLWTKPAHGNVTVATDGSFFYQANAGYRGMDGFMFRAVDRDGPGNVATVQLQIGHIPVVKVHTYSTPMNRSLTVGAAQGVLAGATDFDGDTLKALLVSVQSTGGMLVLNADGSFTFTPSTNFHGDFSFTYQAQDPDGKSNVAGGTILVVGALPVANNDVYTVNRGTALTIFQSNVGVLANDTDAEGDPLTAALISGPSHGSLRLMSADSFFTPQGNFVYHPNYGFAGTDQFTYEAYDIDGSSNVATVTINVVGKPPVANSDAYSLAARTSLTVNAAQGVLANDTDAEGDPLTAVLQSGPAHGTLTINKDGSFLYMPNNNYFGTDSFTYVAKDQDGGSNPATVTLTVKGPQPPVAFNGIYFMAGDTPFTANAANGVMHFVTDAENDPLTAVVQTQPSHGTLTLKTDGSFTYVPAAGWAGDSFTYAARDQDGLSNVATITLRKPPLPPPGAGGGGSGPPSVPSSPAVATAAPVTRAAAAAQPTVAAVAGLPTDVTAQLAISLSSLTFDPTSKHYEQAVTLKNTSASPIVGPLSLVLDNLSSNARLVNQTGVTAKQGPVGSPDLDVPLSGDLLGVAQTVTVVLEFDSPTAAITYKARTLAGRGQR
jgi:VCBS repeat-containing protein